MSIFIIWSLLTLTSIHGMSRGFQLEYNLHALLTPIRDNRSSTSFTIPLDAIGTIALVASGNKWSSIEIGDHGANPQCGKDLMYVLKSLRKPSKPENKWALQLIDALGKLPSGVEEGNIYWTGDYHECITLKPSNGNFSGRYCAARFPLNSNQTQANDTDQSEYGMSMNFTFGMCFPDSCSAQDLLYYKEIIVDIIQFIPYANKILDKLPSLSSLTCAVSPPMDASSIACLVVIIVIILLVSLATGFDWYLERQIIINGYKTLAEEGSVNRSNNGIEIHHPCGGVDESGPVSGRVVLSTSDNILVHGEYVPETGNLRYIQEWVKIFSIRSNAGKLFTTNAKGDLGCVHGIRFLSMLWVIIGHTYVFEFTVVGNVLKALKDIDNLPFYTILNGTFSVDTFFVLSGFLVSYLFYREVEAGAKFSLVKFYFWRFWRLTPVYALVLWFNGSLSGFLGSGPFWDYEAQEREECSKYWWANLLYINNFKGKTTGCMAWSWYLANDMQFYIISPLFLLLIKRYPRIGASAVAGTMAASWVTTGIITYNIGFQGLPSSGDNFLSDNSTVNKLSKIMDYMDDIYIKPYCRIPPYLLGLMAGYLLYRYSSECRMLSRLKIYVGTVLASACSLYALYGTYHVDMTLLETAFYTAFSRTLWAVGICWLLVNCLSGNLKFVNSILSWTFWVPLSRATYCAYLVHPIVMFIYYKNYDMPFMFSHCKIMFLVAGITVYVYIIAILLSLFLEAPLVQLGKRLFTARSKSEST